MSETLLECLTDIRKRLMNEKYKDGARYKGGEYANEEQIRFSLVSRVLLALGWNIWAPKEVCTEDPPQPDENNTRVDIRLCLGGEKPKAVFIECKRYGRLKTSLDKVERQVTAYNSLNGANLIVLTDGRYWYLYLATGRGTLAERLFAIYDLHVDNLEHVAVLFHAFLGRSAVKEGSASTLAEAFHSMRQRRKMMEELEERAKSFSRQAPRRAVAVALVELMHQEEFLSVTEKEAAEFLKREGDTLADHVHTILRDAKIKLSQAVLAATAARQNTNDKVALASNTPAKTTEQTQAELPLNVEKKSTGPVHFILKGRGAEAIGFLLPNGRMQVRSGSTAAGTITKSFKKKDARRALLDGRGVKRRKGMLLFTQAYTFESPLVAAHVICGTPTNPLTNWAHEVTSQPLGEYLASKKARK
jgi:predicted type IV restriction endonuclease